MASMDQVLEAVIVKIKSGQQLSLKQAEEQVAQWEKENMALYLYTLTAYICNPQKEVESRFLSGVLLRRTIDATDPALAQAKQAKWITTVPEELKTAIKNGILGLLGSDNARIRQIAAQVISSLALVELPHHRWPELIEILLNNVTHPQITPNLKQATLETIGFILEHISPDLLKTSADKILTAVVHGMRPDETNVLVKRSACHALYNALDFCKVNFTRENERNVIMSVVIEAACNPDEDIKLSALAILVEIASLHYDKLASHIQHIFRITVEAIKDIKHENIAKQAIEFWCTICEEELEILQEIEEAKELKIVPSRVCQFYAKGAAQFIIPLMTHLLPKEETDDDPNDWTLSMAGATCLGLMAQTVGDDIIPFVMPFIEANLSSKEWKQREAAISAFGQILDGPKSIGPLVAQGLPFILAHTRDQKTAVKDSATFVIGKILKFHPNSVKTQLEPLLGTMVQLLSDKPRVASNAAWAIHNLAHSFREEEGNPLNRYFGEVVQNLLITSERQDSDEENLRSVAYQALNVVLVSAPRGTENAMELLLRSVLERLDRTFLMDKISQDDLNKQSELQGLLCGVVQVIITKLDKKIRIYADQIMTLLWKLFKSKTESNVHEEAFLTVSSLANAIEADFLKYMPEFQECLYMGLNKPEEYQVCVAAVGVVGDLSRALQGHLLPFCDRIVTSLLQNLQNRVLDRSVKPPILSSLGDIASAIGGAFEKYLDVVMGMLKQASDSVLATPISNPDDQYDLYEYMASLREGILTAFSAIILALKMDNKGDKMFPYTPTVLSIVHHVHKDNQATESDCMNAIGICGDLAQALGPRARNMLQQPYINDLIQKTLNSTEDPETQKICIWARNMITNLN